MHACKLTLKLNNSNTLCNQFPPFPCGEQQFYTANDKQASAKELINTLLLSTGRAREVSDSPFFY